MWKQGLDSGMVSWNSNVPFEDMTGYVDGSYFDSEIGYLSVMPSETRLSTRISG